MRNSNLTLRQDLQLLFRPGHLQRRSALAYARRFSTPFATRNEYNVWDVAYPGGEIIAALPTIDDVIREVGDCVVLHYPATGAFYLSECETIDTQSGPVTVEVAV